MCTLNLLYMYNKGIISAFYITKNLHNTDPNLIKSNITEGESAPNTISIQFTIWWTGGLMCRGIAAVCRLLI